MELKTYDPQKVSTIIGAMIATGFEKGTFVEFEFDEDHFTKKTGVDGGVTRTKNGNFTGKLRLTLEQSSPLNDYLSGLAAADRVAGAGVVPVMIRDQNGTTLMSSASAWVQKTPKAGFADEASSREWILDTAQAYVFIGGIS